MAGQWVDSVTVRPAARRYCASLDTKQDKRPYGGTSFRAAEQEQDAAALLTVSKSKKTQQIDVV